MQWAIVGTLSGDIMRASTGDRMRRGDAHRHHDIVVDLHIRFRKANVKMCSSKIHVQLTFVPLCIVPRFLYDYALFHGDGKSTFPDSS